MQTSLLTPVEALIICSLKGGPRIGHLTFLERLGGIIEIGSDW